MFCEGESTVGKRVWQSSALVSPTTNLNRDVAPIGDDIEPMEESRADVETEEEESLEAEIPAVEMNPKNPMSRAEQEHEDCEHAVCRSWCAACVEARGVGRQLQVEPLEEEKRERTTPMVAFDCALSTQENADTFPILICQDNRHGQTGVTCCERTDPTAYFTPLLVDFIEDLGFRRITLKDENEPSMKVFQEAMIHSCVEVAVRERRDNAEFSELLRSLTQV